MPRDFGGFLRQQREKLGMSIEELADLAGISSMQVRKLESGTSSPTAKTFFKLATALDVDPNALMPYFIADEDQELNEEVQQLQEELQQGEYPDYVQMFGTCDVNDLPNLKTKKYYRALLKSLVATLEKDADEEGYRQ